MAGLESPEYDAKIALEIVKKYQVLDEETFDKETDESIPFDENFTIKNGRMSKRNDYYEVNDFDEKLELKKALNYLFEGNSVHYKKRIRLQ